MEKQTNRTTAKRFFRNKLAMAGLWMLGFLFLFSFLGGALSPYSQSQVFYKEELRQKEFAAVTKNDVFRFIPAENQTVSAVLQAQFRLYLGQTDSFQFQGETYRMEAVGQTFYHLYQNDRLFALATLDLLHPIDDNVFSFTFHHAALTAYALQEDTFSASDTSYRLTPEGEIFQQQEKVGFISPYIVQPRGEGLEISSDLRERILTAISHQEKEFSFDGRNFTALYNPENRIWSIEEYTKTSLWDAYAPPSKTHLLGTDKNGMDILTRLMYGGRISLSIGFLVVLISSFLGMVIGGFSGYFGGWVDNLLMRAVDLFYCIPTTPLLIILGAAMDNLRVDPMLRMVFLMLVLGFLGWPDIARLVRGQILFLREQDFMLATEAAGLSPSRRIFRHLLPNVIPQLIVTATARLGSTILTEATLSFLGLGVKFPFASWGNIMNDVSNTFVLTSYPFVWIPAGILLVAAVLGFNFVGDGLRDAFDPKMKR